MEALNRRPVPGLATRSDAQVDRVHNYSRGDAGDGHRSKCRPVQCVNGFILRPVNVPEPHIRHTIERASDNSRIPSELKS